MTTVRLPAKRKYRNQPCEVDGYKFASKREAARYKELKLMQAAGKIKWLDRQISYEIIVNGLRICAYRADFVYFEIPSGKRIVEDSKGYKTREYKIKKLLMEATLGIEIKEV